MAYSLALDSSNAIYITDYKNNRIQKWVSDALSGTTEAGQANGVSGSSLAALFMPASIVLDSNNNIYFTDSGNHRVMYWADGALSGSVIAGITGSAGHANNQFSFPSGLIRNAASGTLYIADTGNDRIMQYLSGESTGTVVAGGNGRGTSNTQLNAPYSFVFDSFTNSFIIVNYGAHNVVRWILGATSWILLAGSASGISGSTSTLLCNPLSVVLDPMNNMYISDTANHRIQLFLSGDSNGTTIVGITGSSGIGSTRLNRPYWAILDSQLNLYVADTFNHRVQKFERY
ncbi:unnamed protein product [Rotaria sp. Silwood2]|nr:unnamed protein product [Rotaria sp. Silwood2]